MAAKRIIWVLAAWIVILAPGQAAPIAPVPVPAKRFLLERLPGHDAVFLGTRHRRPRLLAFVGDLVATLSRTGLTHVALEIASDQQPALDRFMAGRGRLSEIRIDPNIDCAAYRALLERIRAAGVGALAMDLPQDRWSAAQGRDRWMARRLAGLFARSAGTRVLVVAGNLHALKRIQWLAPSLETGGIRHHLSIRRPDLRLLSVAQSIGQRPGQCPYADRFAGASAPVAVITGPASPPPGFVRLAAAAPMTGLEAVDAVIVY